MKKLVVLFALLGLLLVANFAMAQDNVAALSDANLPPPEADKAQIVFLKPMGGIWGGLEAGIFDAHGQSQDLLGTMKEQSRLVVDVAPGEHLFMSHMGALAHFLKAEVVAGKRYFVLVRFVYGMGFQLRPIRNGGASDYSSSNPEFMQWVADTKPAQTTVQRRNWYAKRDAKVSKHRSKSWQTWLRKTDAERGELTLNPEDAF